VFEVLWEPLMAFDENNNLIPDQAESVTPSSDGLTYTIKLKSGWTFHDGTPVDAQSYVDAWNYAADCTNGYILNSFFDKIVGYSDLNPSDCKDLKTHELTGLKVQDDTTFDVKLSAPFSQFPVTLSFDAYDALPKAFFDDPDAFNEQPIGDGPYMMDGKWKHDESITVQRYDNFAGTPGNADKIVLKEYTGDAAWTDFQAGSVDIAPINSTHLLEAEQTYADSLQRFASSSFLYLGFPLYDPDFQSKELRQALSLALDRDSVIKALLPNETPATDLISPAIDGYRDGACQYCTLNVDLGQAEVPRRGRVLRHAQPQHLRRRPDHRAIRRGDPEPVAAEPRSGRQDQRDPVQHLVREHAEPEAGRRVVPRRLGDGLPEHPGLPHTAVRNHGQLQQHRLQQQAGGRPVEAGRRSAQRGGRVADLPAGRRHGPRGHAGDPVGVRRVQLGQHGLRDERREGRPVRPMGAREGAGGSVTRVR
jgi:hypothetical protein